MSLFGRNRDDRRRRALAEERAGEAVPAPVVSPSASVRTEKTQRYTAAAKRENHRRATDYLPRGRISLAGWYFAGLLCVAGLLFAYINAASEKIAALGLTNLFDASQGGSLAGWFSSFVFGVTAMASVLIYTVRRHKLDDYRGRYRLWLWCAAAFVVMSIDAVANLHVPLSRMAKATGWSMLPDGAIWWIGIWGIVMTILALRLLFEMRQCRTAMLAIVGAACLWIASLAIEFGWLTIHENGALAAIGCRLAGQVTLLAAIAIYARHVLLDAEGLLKFRQPKAKKEKPARKAKATETQTSTSSASASQAYRTDSAHKPAEKRTDLQPGSPNRSTSGYATSASSTSNSNSSNRNQNEDDDDDRYSGYEDDDDDSSYGNRKLSKAERKKLRKQMRRQQREEGYDDDQ